MQGEHGSTVQRLIYWLERREDVGEVNHDNYEVLAEIADRWDIPLLLREIDVRRYRSKTNISCSCALRERRHLNYGSLVIVMIYHDLLNGVRTTFMFNWSS